MLCNFVLLGHQLIRVDGGRIKYTGDRLLLLVAVNQLIQFLLSTGLSALDLGVLLILLVFIDFSNLLVLLTDVGRELFAF